MGSIGVSHYKNYFDDQEIVLRFIQDEDSQLYDLLEFIVTEAGGQVSEEINEWSNYVVITSSSYLEVEFYRRKYQTRDRDFDFVRPEWLFKCYDSQCVMPVEKKDSILAKYETKLRWQFLENGNNRYLECRYDSD